jgi:SAM-dependent methyltransferase
MYEERFLTELDGKPRDREILSGFAVSVADPVVEVGCGPGQIGAYVRHSGRRVFGADISPAMALRSLARLDAAVAADMRLLPLATGAVGGVIAFYSLIHVRRSELESALGELARVLRPGGHLLFSAHEGQGELEMSEFLGQPVPFVATFFELDELVTATRAAGLEITGAERREPYETESGTVRLYVEARRPDAAA